MRAQYEPVTHPYSPVFSATSRVLILGTIASPASRQNGFYYAHPANRFWRIFEILFDSEIPPTPAGRRQFLLSRNIALWDVLKSCTIRNAEDASIRDAVPNDMRVVLSAAPIKAVFTTGQTATNLYKRLCLSAQCPLEPHPLPSTSPANARYSLAQLIEEYRSILPYLQ